MNRPLANFLVVTASAVAVALSLLWIMSFFRAPRFDFSRHGQRWEIVADRGLLRIDNAPQLTFESREIARQKMIVEVRSRTYLGAMVDTRANIETRSVFENANATDGVTASRAYSESLKQFSLLQKIYATRSSARSITLAIPIAVLLMFPLSRSIGRHRARRRTRKGLCQLCGYDLRATSDRCPECGRSFTPLRPQNDSFKPVHESFV